jgi:hypothetical protein
LLAPLLGDHESETLALPAEAERFAGAWGADSDGWTGSDESDAPPQPENSATLPASSNARRTINP